MEEQGPVQTIFAAGSSFPNYTWIFSFSPTATAPPGTIYKTIDDSLNDQTEFLRFIHGDISDVFGYFPISRHNAIRCNRISAVVL